MKKERERWKQEHLLANKQEIEEDNDKYEETGKIEPISMQYTETKTRSERVENKKEKAENKLNALSKPIKIESKATPPGPEEYDLPSDVIENILFSLPTKG